MASESKSPPNDSSAVESGESTPANGNTGHNKELESPTAPYIPDGGFWAWSTLLGAFLVQFAGGYLYAFGVYQDFFVIDFLSDFSSSEISWIGSTCTFLVLAGGTISGILFDKGYFYPLMYGGWFLCTFCLFMLSLIERQHYYQAFLSLGLGFGIGAGAIYVPSIAIVAHHFTKKRALAMGIAVAGSSLGALAFPIMLNNLIHGSVGFANGVRASAGVVGGSFLIGLLLMRTRLPPKPKGSLSFASAAKIMSKDVVYPIAVLGTFFFVQGVFFPVFYLQLYSDKLGLNPVFGFYSVSILSLASLIGRIVAGAAANTFGVCNVTVFCTLAGTGILFSHLGLKDYAGVSIFAILYGFFSGAYISLLGPLFSSLAGDVSEVGLRIGIAYLFTGLGSLIGTPITGALLSHQFTWWRPIVYNGIMCAAGTVCFFICRSIVARRKGTQKC
ncbi:MFS general substrate transporter [Marasmius fiardii PR-910]|nr:MFS general substrate transporter [Marasmius fiardii PR-910]